MNKIKMPNNFSLQGWNDFYHDLLITANIENFYNYFAQEHVIEINNKKFINGAFIERMRWFQTNDSVIRSKNKVEVLNFFYSPDHKRASELHRTTIYYKNFKEPAVFYVSTLIDYDQAGKIKYFFDVSFMASGPSSSMMADVNKS